MPTDMERQAMASASSGSASAITSASHASSKWSDRAAANPFSIQAATVDTTEPAAVATDKENEAPPPPPLSSHQVLKSAMAPTVVERRDVSGRVSSIHVITKPAAASRTATEGGLLGKRTTRPSPSPARSASHKVRRLSASNDNANDANDGTQRTLFTLNDDENDNDERETKQHQHQQMKNVLVVNDFVSIAELSFGEVAIGQRKSLLLTLVNPSQVGSARVKYEGYVMASATRETTAAAAAALPQAQPHKQQSTDTRFKCDLHVCAVPAASKTTLRITFEPLSQDVHYELVGVLRFLVNDQFRLQCEASGRGVPAIAKKQSLRERMEMANTKANGNVLPQPQSQAGALRVPVQPQSQGSPLPAVVSGNGGGGVKRRESMALVVSPPRHRKTKKMRTDAHENQQQSSDTTGGFHGSWWEKRKTLSDEEWMQRQEKGFTKWMNYVLVDSTNTEQELIIEHPHRSSLGGGLLTPSRGNNGRVKTAMTPLLHRRRSSNRHRHAIDFSSLRVLAMKRMESMWSRAAMEMYRSDEVTQAAANLKNEIADGKLVVRRDRPAYADVGLQEELVELLNNYHPVWLCLALETVLGHRVMAQEKCSLRSVMTYCAAAANEIYNKKNVGQQDESKKNTKSKEDKMPRQLRRVILQHLVHDPQIARRYRLVKNLKTPVESSGLAGGMGMRTASRANPKITGREYFDALMDAFVFKFFMVVLLLDRAAARRSDKFARFPCLFRVSPLMAKSAAASGLDDDANKQLKNSQSVVAEFCRLFLSKEGRIDKHMKNLGYTVCFQQKALDEIDLEIRNIAVDLRDGVRLAKLLEMLTGTPATTMQTQQPLSSFLRVPALSRLQKIHNVEICLHFLQEKCGRDMLESMRATYSQHGSNKSTKSFAATLRDKEDAKLIETMAKAVVDGHRERTLSLLWKLISVFQLRSLVNVEKLTKEILNIKQRMSFRSLEFYEETAIPFAAEAPGDESSSSSTSSSSSQARLDSAVKELLLEWCRAVCANYFIRVSDFSDSFADGRVLSYLLHYYHPMLLMKNEIKPTTVTMTASEVHRTPTAEIMSVLDNERRHFTMVNERVKQLGEVPVLLPEQYDSTNPPDEKVIVTFVCYLQSRLIDSSKEIHAAARLKRWWRSPLVRLLMRRKKNNAARVIQRFWYTSSVKRLAIRRCRRLLNAARLITSYMNAWLHRVRFLKLRRAVVKLQTIFRTSRVQDEVVAQQVKEKNKVFHAATTIQNVCQRFVAKQKRERLVLRKKIVCKSLREKISASKIKCVLQMNVQQKREAREALHKYQEMLFQQRLEAGKKVLLRKVHARCAGRLQAVVRDFLCRRRELRKRVAMASKIQRAVRRWITKLQEEAKQQFRQMLVQQERERKMKVLRGKVEVKSACRIQDKWRVFAAKKRGHAATKIQSMVRGKKCQRVLHQLKKERDFEAAVAIQSHWRMLLARHRYGMLRRGVVRLQAAVRGVQSRQHVLNFAWFQLKAKQMRRMMAKWKIEQWAQAMAIKRANIRAAAVCIQKTWKMYAALKRMQSLKYAVIRMQALVRGTQSRRHQLDFAVFRAKMLRMKMLIAAWTIAMWSKTKLACYHEKRRVAATMIQSQVRMVALRNQFMAKKRAVTKIQALFRGMQSRETKLNFRVFKWRAMCSQKRLAAWEIQAWIMRCVVAHRRRTHAATVIQSRFRGVVSRVYVFDFALYQAKRERCRSKMATWKLQHWLGQLVSQKRLRMASALVIQKNVRCLLMHKKFVATRRAAVQIQRIVRGVQSRQFVHDHAVYQRRQQHLQRVCAAWKIQLWVSGRLRLFKKRLVAVDAIATCWLAYKLRQIVQARVAMKTTKNVAAAWIQKWWTATKQQAIAKQELEFLRTEKAKQRQSISMNKKLQALQTWKEYYAVQRIGHVVLQRVVYGNREKRVFIRTVSRLQSWWRGMLVRLHEKRLAVTEQRKKLAKMALVITPDHPASASFSSVDGTSKSNAKPSTSQDVAAKQHQQQPLTLDARLEMALHMLLHGKRLQEMLFASHTIEMCTRYSRECASKCVERKISSTIFAAIRGLNRSRPHVELLHQLLLVLVNLTAFQRKESKNYTTSTIDAPIDVDDLRAVDALVDLLHVHRDMHVIFVLAARILKHYLLVMQAHTGVSKPAFNQWSEAHRRLRALHELLTKKLQVAVWTNKMPATTPSKSSGAASTGGAGSPTVSGNANAMAKINPKTAVSVMCQLLKVMEEDN